jgi:predicted DNA-binding protein
VADCLLAAKANPGILGKFSISRCRNTGVLPCVVPSVTSSFRMSKQLQQQLSEAVERTGKGKNAIIIEALKTYLKAMERESLAEEARRQSELVSKNEEDGDWYGLADTSGWR